MTPQETQLVYYSVEQAIARFTQYCINKRPHETIVPVIRKHRAELERLGVKIYRANLHVFTADLSQAYSKEVRENWDAREAVMQEFFKEALLFLMKRKAISKGDDA